MYSLQYPGEKIEVHRVSRKDTLLREIIKTTVLLGDPEVTANICCKLRNLPNTDTQNYSTALR